jgi:hypothetical protein
MTAATQPGLDRVVYTSAGKVLYTKDRKNTVMYVECTKNQGGCAAFMSLCEHLLNAPTEAVH